MNSFPFRKFENMHIALWLVKDTCWVLSLQAAGMFMVLPTLGVAIYITWKMRAYRAELFHNLAVCLWITANSVWMTGEFFYEDSTRPLAVVFFAAGILCIVYYYLGLARRGHRELQVGEELIKSPLPPKE